MEAEGRPVDRCQINREIKERNSIREQIRKTVSEITKLITEKARSIYDRYKELRRNRGNLETAGADAGDPRKATIGDRGIISENDSLREQLDESLQLNEQLTRQNKTLQKQINELSS